MINKSGKKSPRAQSRNESSSTSDQVENNGQVAAQPTEPEGEDGGAQAQEQAQPRMGFLEITKSLILRALVIYFITSFFRRPAPPQDPTGVSAPRLPSQNYFNNGSILDLYVFLSEKEIFKDYDDPKALIWQEKGLVYGDWEGGEFNDGSFVFKTSFEPSEYVKTNGSIYLHVYVIKRDLTKKSLNPNNKFVGLNVAYSRKQLNKFKKLKFVKTQNLLTGESELTPEQIKEAEQTNQVVVSHWHPNITINLVTDQTNWVEGTVPAPLNEFIEFSPTGEYYKPVVYFNDFWNLLRDYQPINQTTTSLELRLHYQPLSLFKWQMFCAHSMRNKYTSSIFQEESDDDDQDSLKEALIETSPWLLAATVIVSILHSVFELLAFKNDVQFWNNRKSLEGLSVRLVFFHVFQSLIVLLYVLDNDTNTIVRISCFVGLAIELWKITKVVDISIDRSNKFLGVFPRLKFTDKGSYVETSTKQYDELAFKYLSMVLFPLLFAYAIYSLLYLEHKGWYSWVLNMIYGFLLTFGFIMMTPQLFINYKLKSVAHLPWRMMTYKCLNTFIDDVFAFVIKMPTMYRLGCFRDDVVFFIYLYQRWIYKTDPTRVNEFGFSAEMEEENKTAPGAVESNNTATPPAIMSSANGNNDSSTTPSPKSIQDKKQD